MHLNHLFSDNGFSTAKQRKSKALALFAKEKTQKILMT